MMKKAVVFDLDGTLIDSLPDLCDCVNKMLLHFGYDAVGRKRIKDGVGNGARELVASCINKPVSGEKLTECLEFYNKIYSESNFPKTVLFNGISEMLFSLKQLGIKIAVCSNKPQKNTDSVYNQFFSQFNFDYVLGERSGIKLKPDPEPLLFVLDKLSVSPKDSIYVGDMVGDYLCAENCGVQSIIAKWGYNQSDYSLFKKAILIDYPNQILSLIK